MVYNLTKRVAVVVISCDKFSDLWNSYFKLFWQNWDDCPFQVYLLSNKLKFEHSKVFSIQVGEDISWSDNLRSLLGNIKEEIVLLLLEDAFIIDKVNNIKMLNMIDYFYKN